MAAGAAKFGIVASGVVRNPSPNNSGPDGRWLKTDSEYWSRVKLPIVAWKIWYDDGEPIDSSLMPWSSAPPDGVQVLMVYHPENRRTIVAGKDEYTLPGERASKFGLMIDRDRFEQIQREAIADSWRP